MRINRNLQSAYDTGVRDGSLIATLLLFPMGVVLGIVLTNLF